MALKYLTRTIWLLLLINTRQKTLADLVECDLELQFRCKSGDLCIDSDVVQNGIYDCPDGSDEECQEGEYACSCGTPRCISKDLVLNGVADCTDGSDEGLSLPCYQNEGLQELLALERRKRSAAGDTEEVPSILDNNERPSARFAGSGPVQIVDGSGPPLKQGVRGGRVSVDASGPNLATKLMSNGVEVIVAGNKKKPILEPLTPEKPKTVESSVSPAVDAEKLSVSDNEDEVGSRIDSSIEEPLEFTTRSKLSTFTYLSTLFENNQLVTSTKEEVITEIVTDRLGLESAKNQEAISKIDGSINKLSGDINDLFDEEGPVVVTKTFFTTSTLFTTMFLDGQTITKSRIEVSSNVVEETITDGLQALKESLFGLSKPSGDIVPTPVLSDKTPEALPAPESLPGSVVPSEAQLHALKEAFLATSTNSPANISEPEIEPSQIFEYEDVEADVADDYLFVPDSVTPSTEALPLEPVASISVPDSVVSLTEPLPIQPVASISVLLRPTVALGFGGKPQAVAAGATVLAVSNAGSVVVVPTDVVTTPSPNTGSGGLSNLLTIPSLSAIGTLGLSAIAQSLAANGGGGLNIQLGPVFNAVSGLLTGGLPFVRRNDTEDRVDVQLDDERKFIPVGAIARPEPRIPLPAVPLVPNAPGSPLLRPGATPNIILVQDAPQSGQGGQKLPQLFTEPKRPLIFPQDANPAEDVPEQPRQFLPGQIPPLFGQDPSRPLPPRPELTPQLGKPVVAPSVASGSNTVDRQDTPVAPVIFKPVEDPRKPIPVPGPGSIVPGPNGPVRLVPVAGGRPPPGVEGTVFIRPVPETPSPPVRRVDTVPSAPVIQPSRELPSAPSLVPFFPLTPVSSILSSVSVPSVQTIVSVTGDNKIVQTNIVRDGTTIVVEPTESGRIRPAGQVVFPSPGLVFFPEDPISPTVVTSDATALPELVEGENSEAVTSDEDESDVEKVEISSSPPQPEGASPSGEEYEYEAETEAALEPDFARDEAAQVITTDKDLSVEDGKTPAPQTSAEEAPLEEPPVLEPKDEEAEPKKDEKVPTDEVNDNMTINNVAEEIKNIVGTVPESASEESVEVGHSPETVVDVQPEEVEVKMTEKNKEELMSEEKEELIPEEKEEFVPKEEELVPEEKADLPEVHAEADDEHENKSQNEVREDIAVEPESEVEPVVTIAPTIDTEILQPKESVPVEKEEKEPEVIHDDVFKADDRDNEISKQDKVQLSALEKPALQCKSECSAKNNEFCDVVAGVAKCVCKRGFSRLTDSGICERALTYNVSMILESLNGAPLEYSNTYEDKTKPRFLKLSNLVKRGIGNVFLESNLAQDFRGAELIDVKQTPDSTEGIRVDVLVHVKADSNISAEAVQKALAMEVEHAQFNVDGETIQPARQQNANLVAEDFDECLHDMHDCPSNANCVNLKGTFTCQCKEGYEDLNGNATDSSQQGRVCAGAVQACKECNFAGSCKYDGKQNFLGCECRDWYAGETCGINLKVLMIALITVGAILLLLISCIILICCIRSRRAKGAISSGPSFLRYRGPGVPVGTLDRTAIIRGDTSSESSGGGLDNHGHTDKSRRSSPPSTTTSPVATLQSYRPYGEGVGMLIPRAKHQHVTSYPTQPNLALTAEELAAREHQLIEYLEKGRGKRARLPSSARSTLERPPHSTFRRGSDGGLTGRSRSIDALSNVSESVHGDRISEVRSYDETTVRPAVKTPPYKNTKYEDDSSQFDSL